MSLQLAEFTAKLRLQEEILKDAPRSIREGKLKRVSGIVLEVEGLPMSIGSGATIVGSSLARGDNQIWCFHASCWAGVSCTHTMVIVNLTLPLNFSPFTARQVMHMRDIFLMFRFCFLTLPRPLVISL